MRAKVVFFILLFSILQCLNVSGGRINESLNRKMGKIESDEYLDVIGKNDNGNEKYKNFNENKTFIKPKNNNSIYLGLSIGFPLVSKINEFQGTFSNYLKDENAYGFNLKIFTNKVLGNNYLNLQYFQGETNIIYDDYKDNFGVTTWGLYCMFEFYNFNICYDFFLFNYKKFYTSFNIGYSFLFFKLHFIDYWVFDEISRNYQIKPFWGLNFNYKLNERFLFQLSLNIIKNMFLRAKLAGSYFE